jgi:signal transduction histidine kinase
MTQFDRLRTVELIALIEEATTPLRHDVRNRIASIRNLSYFVRRKLAAEVVAERDPRVPEFLTRVEGEVQRTDDLIDAWGVSIQGLRSSEVRRVPAVDCVRLAIECARLPASVGVEVTSTSGPLEIEADLEMLALALRCLLENAGEAAGTGSVGIAAQREADQCIFIVTDRGPGFDNPSRSLERFESSKPGHLGLGLCIARRVASRLGGDLTIGNPDFGAQVSLLVPMAGTRSNAEVEP